MRQATNENEKNKHGKLQSYLNIYKLNRMQKKKIK